MTSFLFSSFFDVFYGKVLYGKKNVTMMKKLRYRFEAGITMERNSKYYNQVTQIFIWNVERCNGTNDCEMLVLFKTKRHFQ